jgi:hypothetical protein
MIPWCVQTIYRETETKAAHYTNVRKHPKDLLPFQTKQEEKKEKKKRIIVLYYTNTYTNSKDSYSAWHPQVKQNNSKKLHWHTQVLSAGHSVHPKYPHIDGTSGLVSVSLNG